MEASAPRTYREDAWPWFIHGLLWFFASFFLLMLVAWEGAGAIVAAGLALACSLSSAIDLFTRRRVSIGSEGIGVGGVPISWSDIERHRFRELPPARAGLLLRLTDEARARLRPGKTPAHHMDGVDYDLYLRANGDMLEEWFEIVSLHALEEHGERLKRGIETLVEHARSSLDVQLVTRAPLTLSVHARSVEDLRERAGTIAKALPEDIRWDPTFDGGVVLLLGPLALADEPDAAAAVDGLRHAIVEACAGAPAVEVVWAERSGSA